MLLRQGADVDLVLRLLAAELRLKGNGQETVYNTIGPVMRKAIGIFGSW